jgi:adenosylmethionine-8-amino-7-oxononanoate aminotransferase
VAAAAARGKQLLAGIRQLSELNYVGNVRGMGLLVGLELVEDKATKKPFDPSRKMGERLHQECVKRGLYSRIRGDIFLMAPPYVTSEAQIDRMVNIVGEAIRAL